MAGRARSGRIGPLLGLAGAALIAGVGGISLVSALIGEEIDPALAASPSSAASPTAVDTPTPSPSPTVSPAATLATPTLAPIASPTADPTMAATPVPTIAPTPVPTPVPQQTYVVVEGDTLAMIAQRFGTTVEALQSVNGIDDPDQINPGQVLVIP